MVAGFVILAASNAGGFYGLAVYLGSLESGGRFSLGLVSSLTSVFFLVSGVVGLAVGRALSAVGVRPMVLAGAVAGGSGMWLVGHAAESWQLVVAYVLLGSAMAMTGPIVLTTALVEVISVPARRNQAMAIMLSGMTAGGAVFVPLLAWGVESHGLAAATSVGAAALVVGVAVPALLLDGGHLGRPGAVPVGAAAGADPDETGAMGWGTPRASRTFVLVCITFIAFLGAQVGFNTQLYTIAGDYGIGAAGGALGLVAATGMVARVIGIAVIRWVSPEVLLGVMALFQGLSCLVLLLRPDEVGLYVCAVLLGMAVGNASVLTPVIVLRLFGRSRYARLLARLSFVTTLGIASGPLVVGALRSALASYDAVLAGTSAVSFGVAGLCCALARSTRVALRYR